MIRGIHAVLQVPDNYAEGVRLIRDDLGIPIRREYKAGSTGRTEKGSPSWAEFPGMDSRTGIVVAAKGVFGDDPLPQPALIVDATDPAADLAALVEQGYETLVEPTFDRWWQTFAVAKAPAGVTLVLVQNTGERTDAEQDEADRLNAR